MKSSLIYYLLTFTACDILEYNLPETAGAALVEILNILNS